MRGPVLLSVLDQSPISEGSTGAQALANSLDLARLADRLGYHRYWIAELLALLEDAIPSDHPFARLAAALPGRPAVPAVWLLGSSPQSAIWAAQLGLPYAFADFINPGGAAIAGDYRRRFDHGAGRLQ